MDDNTCLGTKETAAKKKKKKERKKENEKKINRRDIRKEINMIVQLRSKGAWIRS